MVRCSWLVKKRLALSASLYEILQIVSPIVSLTEGARFESPEALETMGPDLISSFGSQSLTAESEAGDEPIKPDRTR
jgi:hypothetical protein